MWTHKTGLVRMSADAFKLPDCSKIPHTTVFPSFSIPTSLKRPDYFTTLGLIYFIASTIKLNFSDNDRAFEVSDHCPAVVSFPQIERTLEPLSTRDGQVHDSELRSSSADNLKTLKRSQRSKINLKKKKIFGQEEDPYDHFDLEIKTVPHFCDLFEFPSF